MIIIICQVYLFRSQTVWHTHMALHRSHSLKKPIPSTTVVSKLSEVPRCFRPLPLPARYHEIKISMTKNVLRVLIISLTAAHVEALEGRIMAHVLWLLYQYVCLENGITRIAVLTKNSSLSHTQQWLQVLPPT